MKKCIKCNHSFPDNLFFCPKCNTINKHELKEDNIDEKKYDLQLIKCVNDFADGKKENIERILELFSLYRQDDSFVYDNYLFDTANEIAFYKIAPVNDKTRDLFDKFYDYYMENYDKRIITIEKGIRENDVKLQRFVSEAKNSKDYNINWLTIVSIALLVVGLILGFVIKSKVVNYIGYACALLGTIATIIVASLSPKYDYKHNVDKYTYLIEEAKTNKKGLEEEKAVLDDIKNGMHR